jgi:hypothetical protein
MMFLCLIKINLRALATHVLKVTMPVGHIYINKIFLTQNLKCNDSGVFCSRIVCSSIETALLISRHVKCSFSLPGLLKFRMC